jgi:exopolyphosphatase/guanosine-5'-triphosphate,3'-diphosphate pyrophosphatase
MRRAVIDIGTNTVKLLVADVDTGQTVPVLEADATTRLGETASHSDKLSAPAIRRTIAAVSAFVEQAGRLDATGIIALATSAVRDAVNAGEFLAACPLPVEVLTGEREAELIFRGVSSDPAWASESLLVLDVGGGSAELIQGAAGKIERAISLPVGAVRLTEAIGDNFAAVAEHLRRVLPGRLANFNVTGRLMIGTGGGITTLARMARGQADHARLKLDELRSWAGRLSAMPLAKRKQVPGLPPERADIIVAGGAVFVVAMELLGASELTVSARNLRYGALL